MGLALNPIYWVAGLIDIVLTYVLKFCGICAYSSLPIGIRMKLKQQVTAEEKNVEPKNLTKDRI